MREHKDPGPKDEEVVSSRTARKGSPPVFFEGISVEIEVEPEKDMYKEDDQEDHPWNKERQQGTRRHCLKKP